VLPLVRVGTMPEPWQSCKASGALPALSAKTMAYTLLWRSRNALQPGKWHMYLVCSWS